MREVPLSNSRSWVPQAMVYISFAPLFTQSMMHAYVLTDETTSAQRPSHAMHLMLPRKSTALGGTLQHRRNWRGEEGGLHVQYTR